MDVLLTIMLFQSLLSNQNFKIYIILIGFDNIPQITLVIICLSILCQTFFRSHFEFNVVHGSLDIRFTKKLTLVPLV
jgi:hypothetical protein